MSKMAVFVDNSKPPEDRRGRARHPLGALAYLDIGADNGGIVLNVSEDGLALQAVSPLDQKSDLKLRIQLPRAEGRIETAARVVWLGQSNRQAGVRFLQLPPGVSAQISRWIQSQSVSVETEESSPTLGALVTSPAPKQTPTLDSQREKWLSLMKEFEAAQAAESARQSAQDKPVQAPFENQLPEASAVRPRPEIVSRRFGERPKPEAASNVATEPSTLWGPYTSPPIAPAKSGADKTADRSASASFSSGTQIVPSTTASSAILLPESVAPAADVVGADDARDMVRRAAAAATRIRMRNQIAAVALFALFSIVCFGIGTWVGHLANRRSQVPPEANATAKAPSPTLVQPAAVAAAADHAVNPRRSPEVKKKHPERAPARVVAENRKHNPVPASQPATPPATEVSQARTVSLPTQGNLQAVNTNQYSQSSAGPAETSPVNYVPEPPRVVDGRVLKPSDRFNPCHLTYQLEPTYPTEAREQGIQGTVKIHLVIASDGSVSSERYVSGPAQLASAALDAAKYWRYLPALLNGAPVQTEKDVEVPFRLPR